MDLLQIPFQGRAWVGSLACWMPHCFELRFTPDLQTESHRKCPVIAGTMIGRPVPGWTAQNIDDAAVAGMGRLHLRVYVCSKQQTNVTILFDQAART